jgi:tetratricopeptide (TPR) repeat protein
MRVSKWIVIGVVIVGFGTLAATGGLWAPSLVELAIDNKDDMDVVTTGIQILIGALGLIIAAATYVRSGKGGKTGSASGDRGGVAVGGEAVRSGIATGRGVAAGHDLTGGVIVTGENAKVEIKTSPESGPVALASPLHQLPPPPGDFVGREAELDELVKQMERGGVTISGIQGMGGIGKTALALKVAQQLADRYPDAQIFLDLHGASEETALTASEAMAHVVRSFNPTAQVPESEAELKAMYLSALHGKRVLLLMDNAPGREQAAPLVPPDGCVLLVTSRRHFALPGLFAMDLDKMAPGDACELLLAIAPSIGDEAEEIARLCGYLPMAMRTVGSALAERPDLSPSGYVKRLAGVEDRLKLVEESLGLSYDLLGPEMQGMWRGLSVFPETFDVAAVAAVWEVEAEAARDGLSELRAYSLVEWSEGTDRYRLHDLARVFAGSRLGEAEGEAARRRHAAHFLGVLGVADDVYLKGGDDVMRGLSLFDLERGNIEAGQARAAARAEDDDRAAELTNRYPGAASHILALRLHPGNLVGWLEAGLASARRREDRVAEGNHLGNLGIVYRQLGETRRAIEYHERAVDIHRELGDRRGEGNALGNLGSAYFRVPEIRRAIEYYELQLVVTREIGDRRGEGNGLSGLGITYADLGETRRAIEHYEQALVVNHEMGDRQGEAGNLGNMGIAYAKLGETRTAIEHCDRQLVISREIGDRQGECNALSNLGVAYKALGKTNRAIECYEQALNISREIGDRRGEGNAVWNMALALDVLGDWAQAIGNAEAALQIFEQFEDPNVGMVRDALAEWRGQG